MKKIIPVLVAVALIVLIGGIYLGQQATEKYSYSKERADLASYFGVNREDRAAILLGDEWIETQAGLFDGGVYLTVADMDALLCSRFYYGEKDQELLYTTSDAVIRAPLMSKAWSSSDGTSGSFPYPIVREEEGERWILLDHAAQFARFTWDLCGGGEEPSRVRIVTDWTSFEQASVVKKTELRLLGGVKSEVLREMDKGEKVVVLEKMETWSKVRTQDAFTGYIENKRLGETITMEALAPQFEEEEFSSISKPYAINMAWHAIYAASGNDTLGELVAATNAGKPNGLNTIAPTWFALSDGEGSIVSLGTKDYVERAHGLGLEVWAVVDNFNNEGADAAATLSTAATRARLTDHLIEQADALSIDGINVDFEQVPSESGEDFIQWIRELSVACRRKGLVLSVDNYVPMGALNDYYDRAEQGLVADYVVVMAYDEHYRGSSEAGSVASIGYVEDGIRRTAAEVPPEKIIGGLPFYTRVWSTKSGEVTSDALSMPSANEWIKQRSLTPSWDEETCQNYAEITDTDGALRQVWLEDAESIRTKVTVMRTYGVAGVAAWQLGFETPDIWDVIAGALTADAKVD